MLKILLLAVNFQSPPAFILDNYTCYEYTPKHYECRTAHGVRKLCKEKLPNQLLCTEPFTKSETPLPQT